MDGWLNIYKPQGITSCHVVNILKYKLCLKKHKIKIGHAGTLDPMATGILPIAIGKATKSIQYMMDCNKEYQFSLKLGIKTDTGDRMGREIERDDISLKTFQLAKVIPDFKGLITQVPPRYSALKVNGERAYDLARKGVDFVLEPRQVFIYDLDIIEEDGDLVKLNAVVSKGTYIRTLGEDIAKALGTFGHLTSLNRSRVGPFKEESSIKNFSDLTGEDLVSLIQKVDFGK